MTNSRSTMATDKDRSWLERAIEDVASHVIDDSFDFHRKNRKAAIEQCLNPDMILESIESFRNREDLEESEAESKGVTVEAVRTELQRLLK